MDDDTNPDTRNNTSTSLGAIVLLFTGFLLEVLPKKKTAEGGVTEQRLRALVKSGTAVCGEVWRCGLGE